MPKFAALATGTALTLAGMLLFLGGWTWPGVALVVLSTPFDILFVRALAAEGRSKRAGGPP